jgi:hypothetical protein
MRFIVTRSRGDAETLGSDRDSRIVDRLDVDAVPVQQEVACRLAAVGITDHDRDDVRWVVEDRQARRAERVLGDGGDLLVLGSFLVRSLQVADRRARAGGNHARQGGRENELRRITPHSVDD